MEGFPLHRDDVHPSTDYQIGCRCDKARRARAIYASIHRAGRRRSMPNIGAQRRLQALACMGWSLEALVPHVDMCRAGLQKVRAGTSVTIEAATWTKVAKLYAELCDVPGPNKQTPLRARNAGWFPPESWIDIDHPREVPTPPRKKKVGVMARVEEYLWLVSQGESKEHAMARIGVHHEPTMIDYLARYRRAYPEAAA